MSKLQQATEHLSKAASANLAIWLKEPKFANFVSEIETLIDEQNWSELEDAFFKTLEFGTGGRRGKVGAGPNRINQITVGESTQGLCAYLQEFNPQAQKEGIVIAYDTRLSSQNLAEFAASVAAANGFRVLLFDGFRATPELSFAVRHSQAAAGIVISASHNPPQDNGFKAYWSNGGQLIAPHDKGVLQAATEVTDIKTADFATEVESGRIKLIGAEIDQAYVNQIVSQSLADDRGLKIIYSPLHGAGQRNVLPVLRQAGFEVIEVAEQMTPDGNFPTVANHKPNPEEPGANLLAEEALQNSDADIALTTDPDADRLAVLVKNHDQTITQLNGNQSAVLIADYILRQMQAQNQLSDKHFLAKTIVTTDLLSDLAKHYKINCFGDMLVGFKFIGATIDQKMDQGGKFIMAGEESYGVLVGDYARDKDAASGALPIAEAAAELKRQGQTLVDRLHQIYQEFGIYVEDLASVEFPGADGFATMQRVMSNLREQPPAEVAGEKISAVRDYQTLVRHDLTTQTEAKFDCFSTGNVLVFELGDYRRRLTIRPSGTEPKLKLYLQWHEPAADGEIADQFTQTQVKITQLLAQIKNTLLSS